MYKSEKSYQSIILSREDFLELETILKEKFSPGNAREKITVSTPNRTLSPGSWKKSLMKKYL